MRRNGDSLSALRRARLHRNWTLDDAVVEIDRRSRGGASGATASLLSSWERAKVRTSPRYRRMLCEIYKLPVAVLFAHQDSDDATPGDGVMDEGEGIVRLLGTHADLLETMVEVAQGAQRSLAATGSRARQVAYLKVVEEALRTHPTLIHHRVLFGPPHHLVLQEHLLRLLEIRDPTDRRFGMQTLHIGMVNPLRAPERFIVASELAAVVAMPSLTAADAFDTGVLMTANAGKALVQHVRELYAAADRLESAESIRGLTAPWEEEHSARRRAGAGRLAPEN